MRSSNIDYVILCICYWKQIYLVENDICNNKHIQNIFLKQNVVLAKKLDPEIYVTLDIIIVLGNETL